MPTVADTPPGLPFSQSEAESFLAALDGCASLGIAAVAGPELRFIAANAAFSALAGSPDAPLIARTVAQVLPHLSDEVRDALRGTLLTGVPRHLAAAEIAVGAIPECRWWSLELTPIPEHDPPAVLLVAQEVTAHVRGRERLQRDKEKLRRLTAHAEAARQEAEAASNAKSRFLSTLSHEVRTPLTAVIGLAELLSTRVAGPMTERQLEFVSRIQSSAWHLVGIIDEILTYSRSEAGHDELTLAPADVAHVVREVAQMFAAQAEEQGLSVHVSGAEDELVATVDAGKLRQVLINLVGNACKYTESGSVGIALAAREDALEFRVQDTGRGIAAERLDDIFEPFVQLRDPDAPCAGGAGLGLTICRRLARLMGGDVSVASVEGAGSTFTLTLPRAG